MSAVFMLLGVGLIGGASAGDDLRVTVKQGVLEGVEMTNRVNKEPFYAFLGIPYAKPPTGERRFKAPEDAINRGKALLNATQPGLGCVIYNFVTAKTEGSEDCLLLNIYTTKKPHDVRGSLRPVMFWIHHGVFLTHPGVSNYGPDFLIRHDVILVTIQYRLNVFGFLSMQNEQVPGNAGLKDQVKALQWVKENIAAFGGDPNCVTIFGEGAGAASVHYLMLSPNARGLFHRAISMTGVTLNSWASVRHLDQTALKLGELFDCNTDNSFELVHCLQNVKTEDLAAYQYNIIPMRPSTFFTKDFHIPCIEPEGTKNGILTEHPIKVLEAGAFADVPFMLGITRGETVILEKFFSEVLPDSLRNFMIREMNSKPHLLLPRNLDFGTLPHIKKAGQKMKRFYLKNERISNETIETLAKIMSDTLFLYAIHEAGRLHAEKGKSPVYFYHFMYRADFPDVWMSKLSTGLSLRDDIGTLFYGWDSEIEIPPMEMEVYEKIQKLWVNFAKFGNPTPDKASSEVIWEPFSPEKKSYLEIDRNFSLKTNLEKERMEFWTNLIREGNVTYL